MCGIDQAVRGEGGPMDVEHILAGKGREVRTIGPEATVSDALHRMHDERVGALVVSDRGVMDAIATHGTAVLGSSVGSVMTRDVFTCSRDDRVSGIMALMTKRRIRHVPVPVRAAAGTDAKPCRPPRPARSWGRPVRGLTPASTPVCHNGACRAFRL